MMMEGLLLRGLPTQRFPVLVRYALAALIVGLAFLIRLGLEGVLETYPLFLLIPAVFLVSLLLDRGSAYFAIALSALLAIYFFVEPRYSFVLNAEQAVVILLYLLICFGITTVTVALRLAVERAVRAEESQALLLEELAHRTKNNLAMITSLLTLQAAVRVPRRFAQRSTTQSPEFMLLPTPMTGFRPASDMTARAQSTCVSTSPTCAGT